MTLAVSFHQAARSTTRFFNHIPWLVSPLPSKPQLGVKLRGGSDSYRAGFDIKIVFYMGPTGFTV